MASKSVLRCHSRTLQIRLEYGVGVGCTQTDRESGIEHGVDVYAPEVFADEGQTGLTSEVVGEFLDEEFGHGDLHF